MDGHDAYRGAVNLFDLERLARDTLAPGPFDYVAGGSWDEMTLRENVAAFQRRRLRPRALVNVAQIDTSTRLLGRRVALPVGIAPTARHRLLHRDGEVATARAAAAAGVVFCLSTMSDCSIEEVAAAGRGPRWFQLYVHKDRGVTRNLVERAAAAGYEALVLTVDLPVFGYREREIRLDFRAPPALGNFDVHWAPGLTFGELMNGLHDQGLSWTDLPWLRSLSRLPLVVKGILTAEDARLCVEHGAAAVVVSNHGGRQLDRAPAAIDVLEEVVAAVDGRAEVYLDGGVRRGTDVLVALALGARAVFLGRPALWGLAVAGAAGVAHAVGLIAAELRTAMALVGTPTIEGITRAHVA